jgi:ATP-dependent helicase/nuclease subunit B
MTERPRLYSIPPGAPFLPSLAEAALKGRLVPGFAAGDDPLALAAATIYVPTRRAARELRSIFVAKSGGRAAILPTIRPLGEFDEDAASFEPAGGEALDLAPPIGAMDRLLLLAPLVQRWKASLPAHIRMKFDEDVVVPASAADAVWLARDLSALMDEIEMEGADWTRLAGLVETDLAGWWQVTLDFLSIVTEHFPAALAGLGLSNPGAHRSAMIDAEAARLERNPPPGPVIAAGSTGSIPATARLLSVIARLPAGAVVLPGLDIAMDERSRNELSAEKPHPSVCGHPQFGLAKLLRAMQADRSEIVEIRDLTPALAARGRLVAEAMRPAGTTDIWAGARDYAAELVGQGALSGVTVVEAANERDEAQAIAVALRLAIAGEGRSAALVTADRALARRVSVELARFGLRADDSGGTPLARTPPAMLLAHLAEACCAPGDPVAIMALIKHPLLQCGLPRNFVRKAAGSVELVALRRGTGRPELASLGQHFEERLTRLDSERFKPFWRQRLTPGDLADARRFLAALEQALAPLAACCAMPEVTLAEIARATVIALENLGRDAEGRLEGLYGGDAGEALVAFLRELTGSAAPLAFSPRDWPAMLTALLAGAVVKPSPGADTRVHIWGALEARLQSVDTLVLGGLNEGSWPRRAEPDRFMSRMMKAGIELEPPERRIGQAAHDFMMAMGAGQVILTRSARAGDAPAVASRWLQRLTAFVGDEQAAALRAKGERLIHWGRLLDTAEPVPFATRPCPKPALAARPTRFSVTEIETLRRDPYAVYAKRILGLRPLDPLIRDPSAAERGSLFHDILHRFAQAGIDPRDEDAPERLVAIGRATFDEAALPADVDAVWWPRFRLLATGIIEWERDVRPVGIRRLAEADASQTQIGATGATLSGRADRIDLHPAGFADIIDFKTGSYPSKRQAHMLVVPQLALEGALLRRGAFGDAAGARAPADLAYVRLRANGRVEEETILQFKNQQRSADDLSQDAWSRLEQLVTWYGDEAHGYLSRALPFKEHDVDGDYDHLARVLEWSAGGETDEDAP